MHGGDDAYILQNFDGRVVFVLPYEGRFSLIGTTELALEGDPAVARMEADEAAYLCDAVSRYFVKPVTPDDAVWSYAGVRALYDDLSRSPSAITRDYVLDLDAPAGAAPLLSVLGGKITTYRRLAERVLKRLSPFLPTMGRPWTHEAPLPGGDIPGGDFDAFAADLAKAYPKLEKGFLRSLARRHGSLSREVLGDARDMADLGTDFGGGLHAREVDYLVAYEWAHTAEDVLWRRTKCGLHMEERERDAVAEYMVGLGGAG
jgi:glycerol-3-phosphate dehydrogenase